MPTQAQPSIPMLERSVGFFATREPIMRMAMWCLMLALASMASLARSSAVDLYVQAGSFSATPGSNGTMRLYVGNLGAAGTGNVELTFVTPSYVNVNAPLPSGCQLVYENAEPNVPSIVLCTLSALAHNEVREVDLSLAIDALAPSAPVYGNAMIYPAASSIDVEQDINDNSFEPSIEVGLGTPTPSANINLYATGTAPAIPEVGSVDEATEIFTIGNNGAAATTSAAHFGIATPFFINNLRAQLPSGCNEVYSNPRPNVPEVLICTVPAGLAPGSSVQFPLRLRLIPGGPTGPLWGIGGVSPVPGSNDVDSDRADNHFDPIINVKVAASGGSFVSSKIKTQTKERLFRAFSKTHPVLLAKPRKAAATAAGAVDLSLSATHPEIAPGATGSQTLTVGNSGQSASGDVRIVYALPLYANVGGALPNGCTLLYDNPDFTISQIVQCLVAGPAQNQQTSIAIPLQVSPDAPIAGYGGAAMVVPAAPGDVEQHINDNMTSAGFTATAGAPVPIVGSRNPVDLYVSTKLPDLLTSAPANEVITVGNKGPNATTEPVLVTFITQQFVNHVNPLPAGCSMLYANTDPAVPEIVQCLIPPPLAVNAEVSLAIPFRLVPGAPSGVPFQNVFVRPQTSNSDVEINSSDNMGVIGARTSRLVPHTLALYLHGNDIPGTAGGYTMNSTPAPSQALSINLGTSPSWFSDPSLVGNFTSGATFSLTYPCTVALGLNVTYALASTAPDGSDSQPLGSVNEPISLCLLGSHTVSIPVLTPVAFDSRRLKLSISAALGVYLNLQLGSGTYVQGTNYEGTP